jgi:glutamate 5-kinase
VIDDGAVRALREQGKSLLPSGVVRVDGDFTLGDPVAVTDRAGRELARGLSGYAASDVRQIAGRKTSEIEAILGFRQGDEIIHRDDLVLL